LARWQKVDTIDDDDYRRFSHILDLDGIGDMTDEELQDARENLQKSVTTRFPNAKPKFTQHVLEHFLAGIAAQQDINEKEAEAELEEETEQKELHELAAASDAYTAMRRKVTWQGMKDFVRITHQSVVIEMTNTRAYVLRPYGKGVRAVVYKIRGTIKMKNPELAVRKRWEKL
jgi:hypothetical protein